MCVYIDDAARFECKGTSPFGHVAPQTQQYVFIGVEYMHRTDESKAGKGCIKKYDRVPLSGIFPLRSTYLVLCFIILAEILKIDFN